MNYGRTLNRRNQGFMGSGVDLTSSFLKILYIFLRDSLLNVFVYCFLFLKTNNSFTRCSPPWKQNEGHSQRSNCRKTSQSCSVLLSLLKVHVIVSVCEWVFVCIHQDVIWNYFFGNEGAFRLPFFLVLKKKKKRLSCSILAHLLLPPISYLVWMNLCFSGKHILLFIYSCCSM